MAVDLIHCTDQQLAAKVARESSDGPAFVALVDRFRPRVWRICFRLLDNEQDAADAAQEVFLKLFLHRTRFAGRSKYGLCAKFGDYCGLGIPKACSTRARKWWKFVIPKARQRIARRP